MTNDQASLTVRIAVAVYRRCALALPRHFRREFGDELLDYFERLAADARHRGRLAVITVAAHSLVDLAMNTPKLHGTSATVATPAQGALWQGMSQDLRHAARRLWRRHCCDSHSFVVRAEPHIQSNSRTDKQQ